MFDGVPQSVNRQLVSISKSMGLQIRYVPMTLGEYQKEIQNGYDGSYGPKEFVELFSNASFVVTNSYHGFMFSLIFQLPFVVFHRENTNKWSANEERIANILRKIHQEYRYLYLDESIDVNYLELDYSSINSILEVLRRQSVAYLSQELSETIDPVSTKEKNNNCLKRIDLVTEKECTGCSSCAYVCPQNCISFNVVHDTFHYPAIDNLRCINCEKCYKVCPAVNENTKHSPIASYVCFSNDINSKHSASGGAFYTIAKEFIKKGGVVVGAAFVKDMDCKHVAVDTVVRLKPLQNSKYVQSNIRDSLQAIKMYLSQGVNVLFSGTPCQVAAVNSIFRSQEHLYTIDILCHGVPSQYFWRKYLNSDFNGNKVIGYTFRNKSEGPRFPYTAKITLEKRRFAFPIYGKDNVRKVKVHAPRIRQSKVIIRPFNLDPFYNLFISGSDYRKSCYYCKFAGIKRTGDITIGDCDSWDVHGDFSYNTAKSIILINSDKGKQLYSLSKDLMKTRILNLKAEIAVNRTLSKPTLMPRERIVLYDDLVNKGWKEFKAKYCSVPVYRRARIISYNRKMKKALRKL